MSVRFFRNGKLVSEVDCYQSLNLLAHAQMEEQETGSECGGYGRCGKDRVQLYREIDRKKVNAYTDAEKKHFKKTELESGWRLACQAFPNEDGMDIEVGLII
jgi:Na+-transporting NADH:ubiquinone oxidoreductase subunit NqrF